MKSKVSQCLHRCHLDESLECLRVQTMVSSTPCQSPYAFTAFRKRTRHSDSFGQDWQIHCPASLGGPHPFLPHILLFQEQSPCSWSLCSHVAINQQQLLFPPPGLRSGPLGLTDLTFLQSKGLSRVIFNITVQKQQFFGAQLSL